MTPAQERRVRDLFEEAVDRSSAGIREWIHSRASDDPEVASEVLSLLDHHSRAGEFLSKPIGDRAADLFDEDRRFEPGSVVGKYRIVREIGRGGMGRVYLATDLQLKREVALKELLPSLTRDPAQRERLRREAQAAARLTHSGICTIYDLEEVGDDVFIVAEYIEGHSLRDEISKGQRPTMDALISDARELAEAVAAAHAKGITHRDLKPENVRRTNAGRLKILDFGLAILDRATMDEALPRITLPGAIIGTPAYMAPEQLKNGPIDARTDIFALGVLLYELATGLHPFEAENDLARMARILESEPRPIRELRPDLPELVAFAINRCLRKRPSERFASAAEVLPALTDALSGHTSQTVTPWWRTHQIAALGLYFAASALAWQIKEWRHGAADTLFIAVASLATIAGFFRGHLLFTERMNTPGFNAERRRAVPITLVVDVLIALILMVEGWRLTAMHPLAGTLTIALAIVIALTRLVVEPSTTRAAFDSKAGQR